MGHQLRPQIAEPCHLDSSGVEGLRDAHLDEERGGALVGSVVDVRTLSNG